MKKSILLLAFVFIACGVSLKASSDEVFTKVDVNPVPMRTVAPKAMTGESGLVAVVCVVDESGKVVSASIAKSTNFKLDNSALEAVQNWTFKPAQKDGRVVKVRVTVPVRFEQA